MCIRDRIVKAESDPALLKALSENISKCALPNSDRRIADEVIKILKK